MIQISCKQQDSKQHIVDVNTRIPYIHIRVIHLGAKVVFAKGIAPFLHNQSSAASPDLDALVKLTAVVELSSSPDTHP